MADFIWRMVMMVDDALTMGESFDSDRRYFNNARAPGSIWYQVRSHPTRSHLARSRPILIQIPVE